MKLNEYSSYKKNKLTENRPKKVFVGKDGKVKKEVDLPMGFLIFLTAVFLVSYVFFAYFWFV